MNFLDIMHKETFIAVLIGLSLGLALTFSIYQWQKASKRSTNITPPNAEQMTDFAKNQPDSTQTIIVDQPVDGSIVTESTITLSGSGPSNAYLVGFVGNQETIGKIDANNKFELSVELKPGLNFLTLIATENSGDSYENEFIVVYEPKVE